MNLRYTPFGNRGNKGVRTAPSNGFAKAALLVAALALPSACTTEQNHYYTTVEAPHETQAQPPEDACPPPVASVSCETPRVGGILQSGQSIRVGGTLVSFEPDTDADGKVLMKVMDLECNVKGQGEATIGETLETGGAPVNSPGVTVRVTDSDGATVEAEVALPLIVGGDLNRGEGLALPGIAPGLQLTLDDISVYPTDEPPSALLSLVQNGATLDHLDVQEGSAIPFTVAGARMSAGAPTVSPGVTFGAVRATIEVFRCDGE